VPNISLAKKNSPPYLCSGEILPQKTLAMGSFRQVNIKRVEFFHKTISAQNIRKMSSWKAKYLIFKAIVAGFRGRVA